MGYPFLEAMRDKVQVTDEIDIAYLPKGFWASPSTKQLVYGQRMKGTVETVIRSQFKQ